MTPARDNGTTGRQDYESVGRQTARQPDDGTTRQKTAGRRDDETAGRSRTWVCSPWVPSHLLQPTAASSRGSHGSRLPLSVVSWTTRRPSDLRLLSSVLRPPSPGPKPGLSRAIQGNPGHEYTPSPRSPIHPLAVSPFRPISVSPIRPSPFPVGNRFCVSLRGRRAIT